MPGYFMWCSSFVSLPLHPSSCIYYSTSLHVYFICYLFYRLLFQLSRGGTFIIGIIGSRDTNDFEITATISTPKPITLLSAGMSGIDCQVLAGSYRYFAIKIDPRQKGKIVLHLGAALSGDFERLETSTFQNYGRGESQNVGYDVLSALYTPVL